MVAPGFFHIHSRNALSDTLGLEQRRRPSVFLDASQPPTYTYSRNVFLL